MGKDIRGKRALITGASSGIGECLAVLLAERGVHLVLSARRKDRLEALATKLRESHGVEVSVLAADLIEPDAPQRLFDETEGIGKEIHFLINNAGFGTNGYFEQTPWEKTRSQMQLNQIALTELTYLFLVPMRARREGWIMNVASIAAFLPVPGFATYAGGKAYVRNFSEALSQEVRGAGILVSALCPGPTSTEFADVAGHDIPSWQQRFMMPVRPVAMAGLKGLLSGKRVVLPGFSNRFYGFCLRFIPRVLAGKLAGKLMLWRRKK